MHRINFRLADVTHLVCIAVNSSRAMPSRHSNAFKVSVYSVPGSSGILDCQYKKISIRYANKGYLGSILRVKASEFLGPDDAFTPCTCGRKDRRGLQAARQQILCNPCTSPKGGHAVRVMLLIGLSHYEVNSTQSSCLRQLQQRGSLKPSCN